MIMKAIIRALKEKKIARAVGLAQCLHVLFSAFVVCEKMTKQTDVRKTHVQPPHK